MGKNIEVSDFVNLKKKIKDEVLRRKYTGTVEPYGGINYDFTTIPVQGKGVETEHINKMITPLKAVDPNGIYPEKTNGGIIEGVEILDARVTLLQSKPMVGSDTGCATSCTGLCSSSCQGECTTGCSNSCSGCRGCGGACSSGCTGCGSCSGCGGACSYSCSGNCSSNCDTSCTHACAYNCSMMCSESCGTNCTGGQC